MAFQKFANANIIRPDINVPAWDAMRSVSKAGGALFAKRGTSKISIKEYSPTDYMLSHCTIVASVDTEEGPGKLGRHMEGAFEVDRQYSDYLITPETSQYVNNNNDAWERRLLLSSFRTFIGGENYVEHLQIPEMSKGKIIDAVARDIGDSIYIDILVATNRKHRPLIAAINSRQLQTLSMGCNVTHTVCTKCGNVAQDETQLCAHIKYEKGNTFIDHLGKTRKVAELCGHINDEPNSVKFIEASWVANPAFTGAVLRNILTPEEAQLHAPMIQAALNHPTRISDRSLMSRAARSFPSHAMARNALDFGQGQEDEFGGAGDSGGDAGGDATAPKEDPLNKAVDDLAKHIRDKALQKVREDMSPKNDLPANLSENRNDTLIREASQNPYWKKIALVLNRSLRDPLKTRKLVLGLLYYKLGSWRAVQASNSFSGQEILAISRVLDTVESVPRVAGEARIYRTVLAVGGSEPYGNEDVYLTACRRVLGRELTTTERESLIVKGKLFDLGMKSIYIPPTGRKVSIRHA